jgi:Bacterial regulatory proteins, tetR family
VTESAGLDDRTIEQIAARVATALRDELADIAARTESGGREDALTVDDVARRLGVARSTVYTHWQEWGGYKLGPGDKAAIRFHPGGVPAHPSVGAQSTPPARTGPRRSRPRGRTLLRGRPRLPMDLTLGLGVAPADAHTRGADGTTLT